MPNQQTNQPTGLNPPVIAPPVDLPPLPPDISSQGSPAQSVSQSDATPGATDQPTSPVGPTPPGDSSIISSSPKKKFGGGKIIATILGVLLLVGGVGAGIYLTQQKQVFQQKAYTSPAFRDKCGLVEVTPTESPNCPNLQAGSPSKNNVSTYVTHFVVKNITNQEHVVNMTRHSNYCLDPYGEPQNNYTCQANPVDEGYEITLAPGASEDVVIQRSSDSGQACGSYQTDLFVNSVDGNTNCNGDRGNSNLISWGLCKTGIECPAGSGQCTGVFAASSSGAVLTDAQLTALTPGTEVYFCTRSASSGGSFDKVQFKVGDTVYPEIILGSINPPPSGNVSISSGSGGTGDLAKCQKYQIKAADKTVNVKAKLHHTISGWVGETF